MRSLKAGFKIVLVAVIVAITGCASSNSSGSLVDNNTQHQSNDQNLSLIDHLRRINSVRVSGSGSNITVVIRSNYSLSGGDSRAPLYVINGQEVGRDFSAAARMAHKGTITNVRVLTPGNAAIYGSQGGSGVIEIDTKQ